MSQNSVIRTCAYRELCPWLSMRISAGSPFSERTQFCISKGLVGEIKEKRHFRSRKANVYATGLLRLSGAALVLVGNPDLWNRYHAPLFRRLHCPGLRGVFAQG